MNIKKTTIILTIVIFGIILIAIKSFLTLKATTSLTKGINISHVLVDSIFDNLQFNYGHIDGRDTMCCFSFDNKYQIIVWNTSEYRTVEDVSINRIDNNGNIYFEPYLNIDLDKLQISKAAINSTISAIFINIDTNVVINHNKYSHIKKLGLGSYGKKNDILFNFSEYKEIYFSIKKLNNQTVIILVYPKKENHIDDNIITKLFRIK